MDKVIRFEDVKWGLVAEKRSREATSDASCCTLQNLTVTSTYWKDDYALNN